MATQPCRNTSAVRGATKQVPTWVVGLLQEHGSHASPFANMQMLQIANQVCAEALTYSNAAL